MDNLSFEEQKMRSFDVFCKRVLKNEARDYFRKQVRRRARETSLDELEAVGAPGICDCYFKKDHAFLVLDKAIVVSHDELAHALSNLSPTRQKIVLLSYFLDLPDREIGEQLNMLRATVQYQRSRSLKDLRKMLEEGGYDV